MKTTGAHHRASCVLLATDTEVVVSTDDHVIEAVIHPGKRGNGVPEAVHAGLLQHFGLNANQLPLLQFGPGLKGPGPLFYDAWTG